MPDQLQFPYHRSALRQFGGEHYVGGETDRDESSRAELTRLEPTSKCHVSVLTPRP